MGSDPFRKLIVLGADDARRFGAELGDQLPPVGIVDQHDVGLVAHGETTDLVVEAEHCGAPDRRGGERLGRVMINKLRPGGRAARR